MSKSKCRTLISVCDVDMRAPVRSTCCEQVQMQDLNQCVQYLMRASEGYLSLRRGCDEKEEQ